MVSAETQPLLTSVEVVCREVPGLTNHEHAVRRIDAFLDYSPQVRIGNACERLPLRLVKRVFARQKWSQADFVLGLRRAAFEGKIDVIEWLCGLGGQTLNISTCKLLRKASVVWAAASRGRLSLLQRLVEIGVKLDKEESTGLPDAAGEGHFAVVQCLVEHGAAPDGVDYEGHTALHWFTAHGNFKMARYMVANGVDVQLKSDGKTALHFAAEASEQSVALVRFLLDKGVQASETDTKGQIPLHYAILSRNFEISKLLTQERFNGEDPFLVYVQTALFEAATGDSVSTVEFITNCYDPPLADLQHILIEAVKGDRFRIVKYLIEYGVDIHETTFQGRTLLHKAATNGAVHSIELLLEQGLNPHEADKFGVTPVFEASRRGHTDAVSCLLEATGSIDDRDLAGQTALHLAAQGGHKNTVCLLVKKGADISRCDKRGWTWMDVDGHHCIMQVQAVMLL
ncbi:hypothetical protein V7S43_009442 [Phytophthora oleae]|uniref:Ankyrin repeat protein n=1 Tax=Phytophthora oleae TaxID=2107226 RepID=A0ABD3FG65_9STRA